MTGGFVTPALLSTGQNRELALFAYVAVLDLASLAMMAFKPWWRLLVLSYAGTSSLYVGWYSEFYDRSQVGLTLAFATLFFAISAIAPLVALAPENEAGVFASIPFILVFVNAVVYFLQIYAMFEEISKTETAWFALGLAAVYIYLSWRAGARFGGSAMGQKLKPPLPQGAHRAAAGARGPDGARRGLRRRYDPRAGVTRAWMEPPAAGHGSAGPLSPSPDRPVLS